MPSYKITTDLFQLPDPKNRSILYAPRRGVVFEAERDLVAFLAEMAETGGQKTVPSPLAPMVAYLVEKGVVNGPEPPAAPRKPIADLSPTLLTLFPTNRCNLACRYCYAADCEPPTSDMRWETASAAIRYYLDLMKREKRTAFNLCFHGGGEPLAAFDLVRRVVETAEARCRECGYSLHVHTATNGVLSRDRLRWIVDHFSSLYVSFDGPPDIQNAQRPGPNDAPSFPAVDRALRHLDEKRFPYAIRCTVTRRGQDRIDEIVDFIAGRYGARTIFLEPAYGCGRAAGDGVMVPDFDVFTAAYRRIEPRCAARGVHLAYSGARFERIALNFCYVGTDDFAVTVDGDLTNCWEVTGRDHPLADTFIFGQLTPDGALEVDEEKLAFLRRLCIENLDYCRDCFARWHCAGDCLTRLGHRRFDGPRGGDRCRTNRELIAHRLRGLLDITDHAKEESNHARI